MTEHAKIEQTVSPEALDLIASWGSIRGSAAARAISGQLRVPELKTR